MFKERKFDGGSQQISNKLAEKLVVGSMFAGALDPKADSVAWSHFEDWVSESNSMHVSFVVILGRVLLSKPVQGIKQTDSGATVITADGSKYEVRAKLVPLNRDTRKNFFRVHLQIFSVQFMKGPVGLGTR